jgi:hypothetical protein
MACIVEIPEPEARHIQDDKQVTYTRTLVDRRDVERELRIFACDVAEDVLPIFQRKYPDDKRPQQAIEVARLYVDGKVTKEELSAAWDAARAAAGAAAWAADAAGAAAGAAAWAADAAAAAAAAWDAAWDAARAADAAAAAAAAGAAARAAAWDAARKKYRDWFNQRMDALFEDSRSE